MIGRYSQGCSTGRCIFFKVVVNHIKLDTFALKYILLKTKHQSPTMCSLTDHPKVINLSVFSRIKKIPYQAPPTQLGPQNCKFWKNTDHKPQTTSGKKK